jgi:hypothetical protein
MRPALAWTETAAAILFLVPFTTVLDGYLLLLILIRHWCAGGVRHGGAGEPGLSGRLELGSGA